VAVSLAFALALAAPADAAPLDDAKAAVEASDYLKAKAALAEALASGANGREELAEIYRLSGIVAGALGDAKAATAAFQRALVLSPKVALPPGTSPKIGRPFAAAQELAKKAGGPLEIRSETAAEPPSVTVIVVADPLHMIARVRATVVVDGKPEQSFERPGSELTTIELPAGARLDVRVAVIDEKGNRLAELGSREVPIVIVGKAPPPVVAAPAPRRPPPPPPHAPRPLYLTWWLWGGAAVAFGAAATYFGIDAVLAKRELDDLNRHSVDHDFSEAKDVEAHARRSVFLTNFGYGAAGALAVASAVLYLTSPRAPRGERLTVAPVRGGGALVLGGSF
ncbi:MAG TPA: hypothetical protein VN253_09180, partial [Kofleriaceae bacterium]|nr:hypothetical protein [Kofleriaceae bacterium]